MIASFTQRLSRPQSPTVVVIGGGFSGAAVAAHLAEQATSPIRVVMFEPARRLGRGVAYSAVGDHLLLNVPAAKLSMFPDRPEDFLRWARARGREAAPGAFLPRSLFGEYTQSSLAAALQRAADRVIFERRTESAAACWMDDSGSPCVRGASGEVVVADQVVLAFGHGAPRAPSSLRAVAESRRFVRDPWAPGWAAKVARGARRALFVGSGLTMLDAAVSLDCAGFEGDMVAVSRRGLVPAVHAPSDALAHAEWAAGLCPTGLVQLSRAVRERASQGDWRSVVDSLRPHTARLWRSLSGADQRRALDRLGAYWDVHRHRCPPETAARIGALRASGRLEVCAGSVASAKERNGRIEVGLRQRGVGPIDRERFDAVVLCTGPEADLRRHGAPLTDCLIESGAACAHPLGVGLRTSEDGWAIGRDGGVSGWLSAIGPLRRGDLWESTAVPEISRQAAALGAAIVQRIDPLQSNRNAVTPKEIGA